jgi:hypothetical protein
LTSATCSGGKTTRSTRPRKIHQTRQAISRESSPPLTHHLAAHLKPRGDLDIRQTIRRVEHQLRALHIPIRQRQLRRATLKLTALLRTENDLRSRHRHQDSPPTL